jgi:hypothetical protein
MAASATRMHPRGYRYRPEWGALGDHYQTTLGKEVMWSKAVSSLLHWQFRSTYLTVDRCDDYHGKANERFRNSGLCY